MILSMNKSEALSGQESGVRSKIYKISPHCIFFIQILIRHDIKILIKWLQLFSLHDVYTDMYHYAKFSRKKSLIEQQNTAKWAWSQSFLHTAEIKNGIHVNFLLPPTYITCLQLEHLDILCLYLSYTGRGIATSQFPQLHKLSYTKLCGLHIYS